MTNFGPLPKKKKKILNYVPDVNTNRFENISRRFRNPRGRDRQNTETPSVVVIDGWIEPASTIASSIGSSSLIRVCVCVGGGGYGVRVAPCTRRTMNRHLFILFSLFTQPISPTGYRSHGKNTVVNDDDDARVLFFASIPFLHF